MYIKLVIKMMISCWNDVQIIWIKHKYFDLVVLSNNFEKDFEINIENEKSKKNRDRSKV
jgi:hypothetical protein